MAARHHRRLTSLPLDDQAVRPLGPPPDRDVDPQEVHAWRHAAQEYIAIEQRHGTVDPADRQATRQLHQDLEQLQQTRYPQHDPGPTIGRKSPDWQVAISFPPTPKGGDQYGITGDT